MFLGYPLFRRMAVRGFVPHRGQFAALRAAPPDLPTGNSHRCQSLAVLAGSIPGAAGRVGRPGRRSGHATECGSVAPVRSLRSQNATLKTRKTKRLARRSPRLRGFSLDSIGANRRAQAPGYHRDSSVADARSARDDSFGRMLHLFVGVQQYIGGCRRPGEFSDRGFLEFCDASAVEQ